MKVKSKVWLEKKGQLVIGTGKASILKAIHQTGSISQAARQLNISYRRAWSHVKIIEKRLGKNLLIINRGGPNGGGAVLTDYAIKLVQQFNKLEHQVKKFTDKKFKKIWKKFGL